MEYDKREKHALQRLKERYNIDISDYDWWKFKRQNLKFVKLPIVFLNENREMRNCKIHDKIVYFIYNNCKHFVVTFLTEEQAKTVTCNIKTKNIKRSYNKND